MIHKRGCCFASGKWDTSGYCVRMHYSALQPLRICDGKNSRSAPVRAASAWRVCLSCLCSLSCICVISDTIERGELLCTGRERASEREHSHSHSHTHRHGHRHPIERDTVLGGEVQLIVAQAIHSIHLGVCRKQGHDTFNTPCKHTCMRPVQILLTCLDPTTYPQDSTSTPASRSSLTTFCVCLSLLEDTRPTT